MPLSFEARKIALKQDKTGFTLALSLHPDEIPSELMRDFVGSRYMCVLVRINDDESPTQYNSRVTRSGILCRDEFFQRFIGAKFLVINETEEEAITQLCKHCGIESRTELNGNAAAQSLFDGLVVEFETWKNLGDEF
jgi:hypothetical protein